MPRRGGLNNGWRLFKPKADAVRRRAALAAVAERLNQLVELPPALGRFEAAPCREDQDYVRFYGSVVASVSNEPGGFHLAATVRFPDSRLPFQPHCGDEGVEKSAIRRAVENAWALDSMECGNAVARVAGMVERVIAPAADLTDPIRLAVLGGQPDPAASNLYFSLYLETIGSDLHWGLDRVSGTEDRLEAVVAACVSEHIRLEALRQKATAAGAIGWIDGTARRILALSGLALPRLVELLQNSVLVEMSAAIGGRSRGRVLMNWRDGVISGTLGTPRDDVRYSRGLLSLRKPTVPATLLSALPGRRLDTLVTHPLIPTDPTITGVSEYGEFLFVTVEEAVKPITPSMLQANVPFAVP